MVELDNDLILIPIIGDVAISSFVCLRIAPTAKRTDGTEPDEADKARAVYHALKHAVFPPDALEISVSSLFQYVNKCKDCSLLVVEVNNELIIKIRLVP